MLVVALAVQSQSHRSFFCKTFALAGKTVLTFLLGVLLVPGLDLVRVESSHAGMVNNALQSQVDDGAAVVLSLTHLGAQQAVRAPVPVPHNPAPTNSVLNSIVPGSIAADRSHAANDGQVFDSRVVESKAGESNTAAAPDACAETDPRFVGGFQSLLRQVSALKQDRVRQGVNLAQTTIVGTASTYNPYSDGGDAEYFETASGDLYDPADWTAAIQIDLRYYFGGVRYGRNYRPAYALG